MIRPPTGSTDTTDILDTRGGTCSNTPMTNSQNTPTEQAIEAAARQLANYMDASQAGWTKYTAIATAMLRAAAEVQA